MKTMHIHKIIYEIKLTEQESKLFDESLEFKIPSITLTLIKKARERGDFKRNEKE